MNHARRAPYEAILDHDNYHHVSPAYAARFKKADESEEQYVERLRQELEDKFLELGPDTVVGCKPLQYFRLSIWIYNIGSQSWQSLW